MINARKYQAKLRNFKHNYKALLVVLKILNNFHTDNLYVRVK